jgi:tetratricopeptide (TPR) repeat protein
MSDSDPLAGPWKEFGRNRDQRVAEEVVAMGWLTSKELQGCLQGKPAELPLDQYLLQQNLIAPNQLAEISDAPAYHLCVSCFRRYDLQGAQSGARYRCPHCKVTLVAQKGEESLAAVSLEVTPETLPEDVQAAVADPSNAFAKYIRIEVVGRGGMGSVWKCYDRDLKRYVAVKFLEGAGEKTIQRFLREAMLSAKLDHPNIAHVYDSGTWQGGHYLVMQFVEGKPPSRELGVPQALRIMVQVCRAVHYAHEHGIIHRDVKPENVMLSPDGKVTVLDFGLAREISTDSSISAVGAVVGTPPYMSPEQVRGETHRVDHRSDVYSLGATLFDVLTGRPPFVSESFRKILREIEEEDPPPPSRFRRGLTWEVDAIALKAMEKDPARRYLSAEEMARDLERFLQGEPIQARPSGWFYKLRKKIRRHPAVSAAVALLLVGGLFASGVWLGARIKERDELMRLEEEGRRKFEQGDLKGAYDAFIRASQIDPDAVRGPLARTQEALQNLEKERKRLALLDEERRAVDPRIVLLRQIEWTPRPTSLSPKLEEVIEFSRQLIASHPEWAGAWLLSGWSKRLSRRFGKSSSYPEAREELTRAISLSESSHSAYLNDSYYQRGMDYVESIFEERLKRSRALHDIRTFFGLERESDSGRESILLAEKDLRRVQHGTDYQIGTAYLEAVLLFVQGKDEAALERLRRNDATGSLEEIFLQAQLECFGRDGSQVKFGLRTISELGMLAERCDRHRLHLLLALFFSAAESPASTTDKYLNRAIEIDPSFSPQYLWRGFIRERRMDYPGALADYTAIIEREPDQPDAYCLRADLLRRTGKPEEAESDCARALTLAPDHPKGGLVRAALYADRKQIRQAIEEITRVLAKYPDYIDAVLARARAYAEVEQWDSALSDYSEFLKLLAAMPDARGGDPRKSDALVERAAIYARRSDWNSALQDLDVALRFKSEHIEGFLLRAQVLRNRAAENSQGKGADLKRAQRDLEAVIRLDSKRKAEIEPELKKIREELAREQKN